MPVGDSSAGILQVVRMVLDEQDARRTEKEMQDALTKGTDPTKPTQNLSRVERAGEQLRSMAIRLGVALAAAFGVRALINFGRESVKAALDANRVWSLLDNALANVGVRFADVRGEVESLAGQFQRAGILGDEEFADVLTTLVQLSGDYEKSLRNVGVVADFAAARHLDTSTAATILGRVMNGNTEILSRYGIEVQKGTDGVKALADQFRGAAAAQDPAVRMQKRITEEWGDFKEALGGALISAREGSNVIQSLSSVLSSLTTVVKNNTDGIAALGTTISWLVRLPGAMMLGLFSGIAQIVSFATSAYGGFVLMTQAVGNALGQNTSGIQRHVDQIQAFIDKANDAAKTSDELARALMGRGRGATTAPLTPPPSEPIGGAVTMAGMNDAKSKTPEELRRERITALNEQIQQARDALQFDDLRAEALTRLVDLQKQLNDELAQEGLSFEDRVVASQQLQTVNDAIVEGLREVAAQAGISGEALDLMVQGQGRAALQQMAIEARGRVLWNVAKAIEMFARASGFLSLGNLPSAAAARQSAGQHLVSAGKWALLSGGMSAIAGGGGGGGAGGSGTEPDNLGSDAARRADQPGVQVTVYVDGVQPWSTEQQALYAQMNQQIKERYGEDSQITYLPTSAAP